MNSILRSGVLLGVACCGAHFMQVRAAAQTIHTIDFDGLAAGTSVSDHYAGQGLKIVNDYQPGHGYRSNPTIEAHSQADTAPYVLVNRALSELYSSRNVPLVLKFAPPVDGIGIWPGVRSGDVLPSQVTVTLFDCTGDQVGQSNHLVTADFSSGLETWSASGPASVAVIDYGDSSTPEVIDTLAFQVSAGSCTATWSPRVTVTSHSNNQVVAASPVFLRGEIRGGSGALESFRINGLDVPITPHMENNHLFYTFEKSQPLAAGANHITFVAHDATGRYGGEKLTLHFGAPASWTFEEFHLTQRGIMRRTPCDAADPLVAGKFTIVRIDLDVRTAGGAASYAEQVELALLRKVGSVDQLVATFPGTTYSPQVTLLDSPSQMTAVHFWIDGYHLATPGEYKMEFQPFVGGTPIGSAQLPPCTNPYFTLAETQPLRLFFCPTEAPMFAHGLGSDYLKQIQTVLDYTERVYPIADGALDYVVSAPAPVSDGSASYTNLSYVGGAGYTWSFKLTDTNGLWRANHQVVTNNAGSPIGGRIANTNLFHLPSTPYGLFRNSPSARHGRRRYAVPMDENYDGIITNDWANYVVEFLDSQTASWTTNLALFDIGETFRSFEDTDRNLGPSEGERVAPAVQRWENVDKLLQLPHQERMKAYNDAQITGDKMEHAVLWFPYPFHPARNDFDMFDGGQGDKTEPISEITEGRGAKVWVRVPPVHSNGNNGGADVLAHELGHNWGLPDTYFPGTPQHRFIIPAWAAYAYYDQVTTNLVGIMHGASALEQLYFTDVHYQHLFDRMKIVPAPLPMAGESDGSIQGFRLFGQIQPGQGALSLSTRMVTGEVFTAPDPTSPYRLVLGNGETVLSEFPMPATGASVVDPNGSDGQPPSFEPMNWGSLALDVVVPLPEDATWAEVMDHGTPVFRVDRSAQPPEVRVDWPNGGEAFGPDESVEITWRAEDPDGGPPACTVLYAPDPAGPWQVLAAGLRDTRLVWDTGTSAGGDEAVIKVVACDGFHVQEDTSDGLFSVEGKPPTVAILSPRANSAFLEHQSIPVRAALRDPEQGSQGLSVSWELAGLFGASHFNGASGLLPPMAPGSITGTVTVVDADGNEATDAVVFNVLADSDSDGMADDWESAYGLAPDWAGDASTDLDIDFLSNFDELWIGTRPDIRDSDGDGVWDGDEVRRGSNPLDIQDVPAPDTCGTAQVITDGHYSGATTEAGSDGEASCGLATRSPATWYAYTASHTTEIQVDTCGALYDTVLSVYTGCPATSANEIACDDNGAGAGCSPASSLVRFDGQAGQTYWIRVSGSNGQSGFYALNVGPTPPENDNCADASVVVEGDTAFDTYGAAADGPDEPFVCTFFDYSQIDHDIWFRYSPAVDGIAHVGLCGSLYDTKLAVYHGAECPPTALPRACNDDACGLQSDLFVAVTAGESYLIRVGAFKGSVGEGVLSLQLMLAPAPIIRAIGRMPSGSFFVHFEETGGQASTYQLLRTSDLVQPWNPDSTAAVSDIGWPMFEVHPTGTTSTQNMYRILAVP